MVLVFVLLILQLFEKSDFHENSGTLLGQIVFESSWWVESEFRAPDDSEDNKSKDDNLSIVEQEEFSAEESETSEIDDEFNQETEEVLLDIPTFLRRQAN